MWPAWQSYFLSQDTIYSCHYYKKIFEDDLREARFWFVHSLMSVFHHNILSAEKEKTPIADIMFIFDRVHKVLNERKGQVFKPLKVREILKLKEEDGFISHSVVKSFESELLEVYKNAVNYLEKWLHQYKEFKVFSWIKIDFNNIPCWDH